MASDSPMDQIKALDESDKRQRPLEIIKNSLQPVSDALSVLGLVGELVALPLKVLNARIDTQRLDNLESFQNIASDELQHLSRKFGALGLELQQWIQANFQKLFLEASIRASETRDTSRMRRIAAILAHAIEFAKPASSVEAEEFMRIATQLNDTDVFVLREIGAAQPLDKNSGRGLLDNANAAWREKKPAIPGLSPEDLQSACVRLQGVGFVTRIDRNPSALSPDDIPYAILPLGRKFLEYSASFIEEGSI